MDKGKHLKRAEIKNKIILELMDSTMSLNELKYRLKNKYNVSRLDVHYHLYNGDYGLTLRKNGKVVIENNRVLRLNVENGNAIVKMLEYLAKDPEQGERVMRFLNRAFLEAFLSPYGDFYFSEGYSKDGPSEEYQEGDGGEEETDPIVATRNYVMGYWNVDAANPAFGKKLIKYGLFFARSIRNDISIDFKVAYILKVMSIWKMAKALESKAFDAHLNYRLAKDPDPDLFTLSNFSVNRMTNQTIRKFLRDAEPDLLLDFFDKVIKKSLQNDESEYFTGEWVSTFTLKPLLELKETVIEDLLIEALGEIVKIWDSTLKKRREIVMRMPPLDPRELDRELERKKRVEEEKQIRRNDPVFKYWSRLPTYDAIDKFALEMDALENKE